jgi:Protein of unknown function (DUF1592)/Protein of unknown function (DUF1588)/Protein of unknown function (DUF1587)/Protein of unknown function (DUF1585)/Protein of unknown function (DUF1595)
MRVLLLIVAMAGLLPAATPFDKAVRPVLGQVCSACHNEKLQSGGLNVAGFLDPASLRNNREEWERILARLRAGEMPPRGVPKPPAAQVAALLSYVQGEFDHADKSVKPDPGRVVTHRLNRSEYSNTIRDLLQVDFRASEEFPADDSGFGFDNIGEVLTVSPTLMQKYLQAAEQIASRAVGGDPLPKAGLFNPRDRVQRLDAGNIQLKYRIEYDADYIVRADLIGHRGEKDAPVNLVISADGRTLKTVAVPVQISAVNKQGGGTQRSSEEVRVYLTEGEHTLQAEFAGDDFAAALPPADRLNINRNIYPESIEIAGPFPVAEAHASRRKFLICDPASGAACADRILTALAPRAYRRPVSKAELAELVRVYEKASAAGATPQQSLQFAITAMLVSPQFLFRIEHDPKPGAAGRISDVELASRLSYFLWSSMPDDELLRVAEENRLHNPAVLDAQITRLIADPKSLAFAENFAGQWLEIRSLDAIKPDAKKFPEWSAELKDAMRTETTLFFQAVLRDDRPVSDFIDGQYTFLNETLARHYGIAGINGPVFRRVELLPNVIEDQRSGVLTQASVLTVSSYPVRTSVVLRGKYVLENILGAPPPPPPPDVPRLNEDTLGVASSLRQQMEQHRADPVCASCHSRMDVLGFGLENYDAVGRWRTSDGKFLVDASGAFPNGKSFSTPAEMKALLKGNMPEFTRCLAEKLLTYSLGRGVEAFDRHTVQDIVRQTAAHDYKFQSMIRAVVHSPAFLERKGLPATEVSRK